MGFLFDDTDDDLASANQLVDQQLAEDKAALAQKNASLFQTRIDILKNSGGRESWAPKPPTPSVRTPSVPATKGFNSLF